MSKLLFKIKHPFSTINRVFYYIYLLCSFPFNLIRYNKIHLTTYISPLSSVKYKWLVSLGSRVKINRNVCIWGEVNIGHDVQINPNTCLYGKCEIGNYVMIAPNCVLAGGSHGIKFNGPPMIFQESCGDKVVIHDDVWIGANCVITAGVTIGTGVVIGAGSVIRTDIPDFAVVYGDKPVIKFFRNKVNK